MFLDIGTIIDESKNMVISKKNGNTKKYVKKDYVFKFKLPNSKEEETGLYLEVNGDKIVGRPENRLRSLKKKKWLK
jgi:RNase P/RNase MRP subunit p29